MTDDDLKQIEARLAAVTRGPWDLVDSRVEPWHFTAPNGATTPAGTVEWQILGGHGEGQSSDHGWAVLHGEAGRGEIHPRREDLLLAAHAPADVKAMAATIRELWQLLDLMRDQDGFSGGVVEGRRQVVDWLAATAKQCRDEAETRRLAEAGITEPIPCQDLRRQANDIDQLLMHIAADFGDIPPPLPHHALAAEVERLKTENGRLRESLHRVERYPNECVGMTHEEALDWVERVVRGAIVEAGDAGRV